MEPRVKPRDIVTGFLGALWLSFLAYLLGVLILSFGT